MKKTNQMNNHLNIIFATIITLFGLFLYLNTINHGYVLDDASVITDNRIVKEGFGGFGEILTTSYRHGYDEKYQNLYRPLSLLMFAAEWQMAPNQAWLGHLINIILYGFTGFIVFMTLLKVLKKYHIVLPFIICLIFIAHPIHTEVVANIKSRDEILSFLFSVLTLYTFWLYAERTEKKYLFGSLALFFLAFLSKEGSVTFILVIPLSVLFFAEKEKVKSLLPRTALYLIPFLAYMMIRTMVLGEAKMSDQTVSILDNSLIEAPILERWATALVILGKYFYQLVWPVSLVSDVSYSQVPLVGFGNGGVLVSLLLYLSIFIGALLSWKKNKVLSYGIFFFLFTLSLYSNIFVMVGTNYAERMLYFASLGFSIMVSVGILKLFKVKVKEAQQEKTVFHFFKNHSKVLAFTSVILVFYGFKTIERNRDWKSSYSLYSADIEKSPNSAHLRYHYGLEVMQDKGLKTANPNEAIQFLDKSIEQFQYALKIYPNYYDAFEQIGLANYRKGLNYKKIGQQALSNSNQNQAQKYADLMNQHFLMAREQYEKTIQYKESAVTYQNFGALYFDMGDTENALKYSLRAIELSPNDANSYSNIGSIYGMSGNYQEAIKYFNKALELNHENPASIHIFLAKTYEFLNQQNKAQKHYKLAKSIQNKS
ncbi:MULTISPECIES: tetratricopeptide repeat protein [unclassified Lentimicrobium]|uniref:tetratricopeptide repeat protein n=1 Tax=unclassified Lentimicrobium TaxID=2677434 RepID=UPI001558317F|nr:MULTISPECIES: tetratricopeptide repeat protein [unclassified Lentimicrobium]NPD47435.1 tetratricopeptide repeat protein [Lentimicrobium sp. S6]NPD86343.1 tetratricopeptide repeat protein [Lentimicrobium sp. L6]